MAPWSLSLDLFTNSSIHPRGSVRRRARGHQVERSRHYPCASELVSSEVAPRVDAQAIGERTGIGGCCPVLGEDGQPDPKKSPKTSFHNVRDGGPTFSDHLNIETSQRWKHSRFQWRWWCVTETTQESAERRYWSCPPGQTIGRTAQR